MGTPPNLPIPFPEEFDLHSFSFRLDAAFSLHGEERVSGLHICAITGKKSKMLSTSSEVIIVHVIWMFLYFREKIIALNKEVLNHDNN